MSQDSRDMQLLRQEFKAKGMLLLSSCAAKGANLSPYVTVRTPKTQGVLWCQSRTAAEIESEIAMLVQVGAPTLASYLHPELAQKGKWVTDALPGDSWHQWGEAMDCFLVVNGKAVWDASAFGYITYARIATELGLFSGRYWSHPDSDHVQFRKDASPQKAGMTWAQIEAAMIQRFPVLTTGI